MATKSLNTRLSYTLPRFSFAFIHSRVEPGNDTTVLYHSGSISYHVSPEVLLSVESEVGVDTIDHDLVVHTLAGEPLTCRDKPKHLPVSQCLTPSLPIVQRTVSKLVARVGEGEGGKLFQSQFCSHFLFLFSTLCE